MTSADSFYTGLVAELYGPLRSAHFPVERYADLIRRYGEPALELGCGDGDPLLALRAAGFDVDGIDASPDMISRLHRRAAQSKVTVRAEVMTMEQLKMHRRYQLVFLAGPTFNLLPTDEHMARALARIYGALLPAGTAVIPLFIPPAVPAADIGQPRQVPVGEGWISVQTVTSRRDEAARTQVTRLRYERSLGGEQETLERDWVLHWIEPHSFAALAESAGLTIIELPAQLDGSARDAVLQRPV